MIISTLEGCPDELEPSTFRTTSNLSNSPIVPLFIDVCDFIENRVCVDFASICMKNLNGGQEIYSDIYCQSPVTFGKKGLTFIKRKPQKDAEDSHLLLFADYIDFLAYESLHGQIFKELQILF